MLNTNFPSVRIYPYHILYGLSKQMCYGIRKQYLAIMKVEIFIDTESYRFNWIFRFFSKDPKLDILLKIQLNLYGLYLACLTWELFDEKSSFDDRLVLSSCSSSIPNILGVVISSPGKKVPRDLQGCVILKIM